MPLMNDDQCKAYQESLGITDRYYKAEGWQNIFSVQQNFPVTDVTKDLFNTVTKKLEDKFGQSVVSTKDFDKVLKEEMLESKIPRDNTTFQKLKNIYKLHAILQINDLVEDAILKTANYKTLLASGMNLTEGSTLVKGKVLIDKLSLSTVKNLTHTALRMALPHMAYDRKGKEKKTFRLEGRMGAVRLAFRIPRSVAMLDPSGAIFSITKAIETYLENQETYVNSVVGSDGLNLGGMLDKEGKIVNRKLFGMDSMFGTVGSGPTSGLIDRMGHTLDSDVEKLAEKVQHMLVMLMHRDLVLDKDNSRILAHNRYAPLLDKDGEVRRYKDGKVMFDFQDTVPLVDYVAGKDLKGEQKKNFRDGIPLDKDILFRLRIKNILQDLNLGALNNSESIDYISGTMDGIKEIMDEVWDTIADEIDISKRLFRKELKHWFRGISIKSAMKAVLSRDLKGIPEDKKEDVTFLFDNFTKYPMFRILDDSPVELHKKAGYTFPIIYDDTRFLTQMIPREIIYENQEQLKKEDLSDKEREEAMALIAWGQETLARKTTAIEHDTDELLLNTEKDMIHYKHITNAFDVRNTRTDPFIFPVFLRRNFGSLQRGRLVVEIMKALRKLRSHPTMPSGLKETLIHYILNSHKQVFNRTDTFAGIPGMIDMSFDKFYEGSLLGGAFLPSVLSPTLNLPVKVISKAKGLNKKQTFRMMRLLNKAVSATYLWRPATAIQNATAVVHKGIEMGFHNLKIALRIYQSSEPVAEFDPLTKKPVMVSKKQAYNRVLDASGVLKFNDFYASSLIEDLSAQASFEAKEQLYIIKESINFWKTVKKKTKKIPAEKGDQRAAIVESEWRKLEKKLGMNAAIVKAVDQQLLEDIKGEVKGLKRERLMGKIVNLALARTWFVSESLSESELDKQSNKLTKLFKKGVKSLSQLTRIISGWEWVKNLSMQKTEFMVRSLSGIMAINSGINSGRIKHKPWEPGFDEEDMNTAISLVREAVRLMDHGMSPTDIGTWGRGLPMGSMMRFKGWGLQHTTTEWRWILEAAIPTQKLEDAIKDKNLIDESKYFFIALHKAMKLLKDIQLGKMTHKQAWKVAPEVKRVLNFLMTSTLASWLTTFVPLIHGFWAMYRVAGFKTSFKVASGMGSLVWNMFLVLPALLAMFAANEDEDDIIEFLRYRVHNFTYHGWAIGQLVNLLHLIIAINEGDKKRIEKEWDNIMPPLITIPHPF